MKLAFAAKVGGHGRLGRDETALLARLTICNQGARQKHTGETRRAPLLKSKSKRLLVSIQRNTEKVAEDLNVNITLDFTRPCKLEFFGLNPFTISEFLLIGLQHSTAGLDQVC